MLIEEFLKDKHMIQILYTLSKCGILGRLNEFIENEDELKENINIVADEYGILFEDVLKCINIIKIIRCKEICLENCNKNTMSDIKNYQ